MPATAPRILIVEDEPALLRALRINLRARGYEVLTAAAGRPALDEATQRPPDAVILDLGLPDLDGIDLIRELRTWSRRRSSCCPGGPDRGQDRRPGRGRGRLRDQALLHGGTAGPAARRAAPRRPGAAGRPVVIGRCAVDLAAHLATRDGEQVRLTPTEWRLLDILIRHPGQLVGGRRLLTEVWGPAYQQSTHYLRFHMAGLRRKLEDDPARPQHLLTEPGMGYRFQP